MLVITIPSQPSTAKAFLEFEDEGHRMPSPYYEQVVNVMEKLVRFALLTCGCADYLVNRYSEQRESAKAFSKQANLHRFYKIFGLYGSTL